MFGENYSVNMGNGTNDRFFSFISEVESQNLSGVEKINTQYSTEDISKKDNLDGWVQQGANGDCRLLSLINSFCGNTNAGNIKDKLGIEISTSGSNVTVKFNRYDISKFGGTNTVTVSKTEVDNFEGAFGDIDTILIDIALNKLIATNNDYDDRYADFGIARDDCDKDVETATYNTLARYLTGSEKVTYLCNIDDWKAYENDYLTSQKLLECWNKYKSGEISNISIGIGVGEQNTALGIIEGHAYSLKNVVHNGNDEQAYVELVNPWDDADVLRIKYKDFLKLDITLLVYGYDIYNQNMLVPNAAGNILDLDQSKQIYHTQLFSTRIASNSQSVTAVNSENYTNSSDNLVSNFVEETNEIQKEIQSVEDNINKAKAIFASKKKFGEMLK